MYLNIDNWGNQPLKKITVQNKMILLLRGNSLEDCRDGVGRYKI